MHRGSYDGEDASLARQLYADPQCTSVNWVIAKLRETDPLRYKALNINTVTRWMKRDKDTDFDWNKRRREYRLKLTQRSDRSAEFQAETTLNQMLEDMLRIRDMLSSRLQSVGKRKPDGTLDPEADLSFGQLGNLMHAYNTSVEKAMSILRGKIQQVDLNRLTPESQSFFIRRVIEDLISYAREVDSALASALDRHLDSVLARMRGQYADKVISDVSTDICIDTVLRRFEALHGHDRDKTDAVPPGVAGLARG